MSAILNDPLFKLRPMTESDLPAVMEVEMRAYPFPWTRAIFHDCLRVGYCCWLMELQDQLVGYGVMSVAAGEAHVLNLCTDPDYQGQGLGRRMLKRLLALAAHHQADTVFLEVRRSNQAAQALYLGEGFNEIGLRRRYYPADQGREDAVVMALSLC